MPGENIQDWSITAANNGTADTSINFAEGQPRASVNNSARSMMAAQAKDRNLKNASIVTGGTANAQTFTSGVGYTTVPDGLRVLLQIGAALTNTGATTLNMDGIGAVGVANADGTALTGGELIGGRYAEFIFKGTGWQMLQSSVDKVSVSGDTMTGTLTAPQVTSTGNINAIGSIGCANVTATGAVNGATVTASSNVTANGFVLATGGLLLTALNVGMFIASGAVQVQFRTDGWRLSWNQTTGRLSFFSSVSELLGVDGSGNIQIAGGTATKPGGGAWGDSSDLRIKNVLGDYNAGLSEIKSLAPVRYTFKGNDDDHIADDKEYIGLIAQDVEDVMPEMVTRKKGHIDGEAVTDLRMLDTGPLIFALVNSVQELLARIEALEAR